MQPHELFCFSNSDPFTVRVNRFDSSPDGESSRTYRPGGQNLPPQNSPQAELLGKIAHLQQRVLELEREIRSATQTQLRRMQQLLAADLKAVKLLYEIGYQCTRASLHLDDCLDWILDAAIQITGAEKGSIQLKDHATGELVMAAQRGFGEAFQKLFSRVDEGAATACAAAMQRMLRVVVENVRESAIFATPWLDALLADGVHAVQATPLVSRAGNLLGVIATYYTHPHGLRDCEFQMMDLLARQAADYLEGL